MTNGQFMTIDRKEEKNLTLIYNTISKNDLIYPAMNPVALERRIASNP